MHLRLLGKSLGVVRRRGATRIGVLLNNVLRLIILEVGLMACLLGAAATIVLLNLGPVVYRLSSRLSW